MQVVWSASEDAASTTQGLPQTSIVLFTLFYKVAVRPAAVIVYGQPPWKEHERPVWLSVTERAFSKVSVVSCVAISWRLASARATSLLLDEEGTNLMEGEVAMAPTGTPMSNVAVIAVPDSITAEELSTSL